MRKSQSPSGPGLLMLVLALGGGVGAGCGGGGEGDKGGKTPPAQCQQDPDCADDNPCTQDSCDLSLHVCLNEPVAGCCRADTECTPSGPCVAATCDLQANRCTEQAVEGCCQQDADCPAAEPCQEGRCDPSSHTCIFGTVPDCCMDDADCPSGDPCQVGSCDLESHACALEPIEGCCHENEDCPPAAVCQTSRCDTASNTCVQEDIEGCCAGNEDCPPPPACQTSRCDDASHTCVLEGIEGCCTENTDCPPPQESCRTSRCDDASHTCVEEELPDCCDEDGDCPDLLPCQVGACDLSSSTCTLEPVEGCCAGDDDCPAAGPCQDSFCDLEANRCALEPVADCCTLDEQCPSPDACHRGRCDLDAHACVLEPVADCCLRDQDCPSADHCQIGRCDVATHGCLFEERQRCCSADGDCAQGLRCVAAVSFCNRPLQQGDLVITELMLLPQAAPAPEARWIELHNPGEAAVFLNGMVLAQGEQEQLIDSAAPIIVPAGAYVVLGASANPELNGGVAVAYASPGLPLPGAAGGLVRLLDPWGTVLDEVAIHPLFPHQPGATLSLSPEQTSAAGNDRLIAWCPGAERWAQESDRGTPGAVNPACPAVVDQDSDGWPAGTDCDDTVAALNHDDADRDGASSCAGDCDDHDARLNLQDDDEDGTSSCGGDCDDHAASVHPGAQDVCGNGLDDDCDGLVDVGPGCPLELRINEVVFDLGEDDGPGVFIELTGRAGFPLDGMQLVHRDSEGLAVATLDLAGQQIAADGFFVVSHPEATPELAALSDLQDPFADLLDANASLVLRRASGPIDALAWGVPQRPFGEGRPAVVAAVGHALSRLPGANADTGDNSVDFVESGPSPRALLPVVDWAATLDPPAPIELDEGRELPLMTAAVRVAGVTEQPGAGEGIFAEVGWGPEWTLPWADERWQWQAAAYQGEQDGADQYGTKLAGVLPGRHHWCFRFSRDGVYWIYADLGPAGTQDGYAAATAGQLVVGPCNPEIDRDGDGTPCPDDCDDDNRLLNNADADGDGYSSCEGDCDDQDQELSPADEDGDGFSSCAGDCDDLEFALDPADRDGDGFSTCDGDCDDGEASVHPTGLPVCGDGLDNDCDGETDEPLGECLQIRLLINEVYFNEPGADGPTVFIELWGEPAGAPLRGWSLARYAANGSIQTSVDLGRYRLGQDGYLLVAHPNADAAMHELADLLDPVADGMDHGQVLRLFHGDQVADALAYGTVTPGLGEGPAAAVPDEGHALTRVGLHIDTGDNAADFFDAFPPTPRGEPAPAEVSFAAVREPLQPLELAAGQPSPPIVGQIRVPGRTDGMGQGRGIEAQLCRGPDDLEPPAWPEAGCVAASYLGDLADAGGELSDDLYTAALTVFAPGHYLFAYRFRVDRGAWVWGDELPGGSTDGFAAATAGELTVIACDEDVDQDDDGTPCALDCDDRDPARNAGDADRDGFTSCNGDCDDSDPNLTPGDRDGDGFSTCDGDCDDGDATRTPADLDDDGYSTCTGDCDDQAQATHPGADLICGDGLDNDCDGATDDAARECLPPRLLINEVYPDEPGPDGPSVFVELWGQPGNRPLRGVRLERRASDGSLDTGLDLDGVQLPESGYLVIAAPNAGEPLVRAAQVLHEIGDCFNARQSLLLLQGEEVIDALAFGPVAVNLGEGQPAAAPATGSALTRNAAHDDTDDNLVDFTEAPLPSPGAAVAAAVDFAALLGPLTPLVVDTDEATPAITGQVHAARRTEGLGQGAGVEGQLCYGPRGSDPSQWPDPSCTPASYAGDADGLAGALADDVYRAVLQVPEAGAYDFAFRFRVELGEWVWGDAAPAGSTDGYSPDDAGKLTVGVCDELVDRDGDGTPCAQDCDDKDPLRSGEDRDGDGYSTCDGDCDDADPALTPEDGDGDGFSTCRGDCDDGDAGLTPLDADEDGYSTCGGDCDDGHAAAYPDAPLICGDGLDNDCDGRTDDAARECLPQKLLINEVYADEPGPDGPHVFVELWGQPAGRTLGEASLERYLPDGNLDCSLDLTGLTLGPDGFLLVAHPAAHPALALLADAQDLLADGLDAGQSLRVLEGGSVVDALAYGDVAVGLGEGSPAPAVAVGHSLARDEQHGDTDDNATDFVESALATPRAAEVLASIAYAALRSPLEPLLAEAGRETAPIAGQVRVPGRTTGAGPGRGVEAQLCWGPAGTLPATWDLQGCVAAAYVGDLAGPSTPVDDDEFQATLVVAQAGTYDLAYRFRVDRGEWVWADRAPGGSSDGYRPEDAGSLVVQGVSPVAIQSFTIAPAAILRGEATTLSWAVDGATSLALTANGEAVELGEQPVAAGSLVLSPQADTLFELTASDAAGHLARASAALTVHPRPVIVSFAADPPVVQAGESATLGWLTQGAGAVTVTDGAGQPIDLGDELAAAGVVEVRPEATTTYTLTALGALDSQATAQATVSVPAFGPPAIISFTATPAGSRSGQEVVLSWQTQDATALRLSSDGAALDLGGQPAGEGSLVVHPQVTTRYELIAVRDPWEVRAALTVAVSPAELRLSEVLYDPTGPDEGLEWVEIYNAGRTLVDLSRYSLGSGGASWATSRMQLAGELPPGGCFVVGGPRSVAENGRPVFDQAVDFVPDLPNPGAAAAGVALFFQPAAALGPASIPFDAVVYGTVNSAGLVDETGLPSAVDAPAVVGTSLVRAASDSKLWLEADVPTPGVCFALPAAAAPVPSWGPQGGGDAVLIAGFGLDPELHRVDFAGRAASCQAAPGGLLCTAPRAAEPGLATVSVTQVRRATVTDGVPGFAALPPAQQRSVVLPTGYRYDWCRLEGPAALLATSGSPTDPLGVTVRIAGVTDQALPGADVRVQVGFGPPGQLPDGSWTWADAAFDGGFADPAQDRYAGQLTAPEAAGSYGTFARVSPDGGQRWMLCDTGAAGNADGVDAPGTLTVIDLAIDSFTALPQAVLRGDPVTVAWTVRGATSLALTANGAAVDISGQPIGAGQVELEIAEDTSFRLVARDDAGYEAVALAEVTVAEHPAVVAFTAAPDHLCAGAPTVLAWEMSDASSFAIADAAGHPVNTAGIFGQVGQIEVRPQASTTYTLTAQGPLGSSATASVSVTVEPQPRVVSFTASPRQTISGQDVTLTWETEGAATLTLLANGEPMAIAAESVAQGSLVLRPQVRTIYGLVAASWECEAGAPAIELDVRAAPLRLTELYRDPPGDNDGRQWVEIANEGTTVVDLANYSLGSGIDDYTLTRLQLAGQLPPGGCLVVGGAISDADNGAPAFDQAADFQPDIPEPPAGEAAGVALFFLPAERVNPISVPIDALVYGTANPRKLIGPDGLESPVHVGAEPGSPVARLGVAPDLWRAQAAATPGRCWSLLPAAAGGPLEPGWGPQGGGNGVLVRGVGLDPAMHRVQLGDTVLSCAPRDPGLPGGMLCTAAAAVSASWADLTVTQLRRAALQDGAGVYLDLPVGEQISVTVPQSYRYDWCRLQWPSTLALSAGTESADIYTRVYAAEITDRPGAPPADLVVEAGWGPAESWPPQSFDDPENPWEWWWYPQSFNAGFDDAAQKEFVGRLTAPEEPGSYWYFSRVSVDGGRYWMTCDTGDAGNADGVGAPGLLDVGP